MAFSVLVVYLILQFALCFYISRQIESDADYLVAGRSFPVYVVAISLFATWFGAETCIGSAAMVYKQGLSGARADPFGYSLCLFLSGLLIARKIWNRKYMTLSDFYNDRYGHSVGQIALWIICFSSLIWAAAQLRAFGQVISATTNFDLETTIFLGFIFVVAYTLLGGLMGDMITDVVQAGVISLGLILLLVTVFTKNPDALNSLFNLAPERLSLLGPGESWLQRIDRWAIPVFGSLVAQEIIARIFSAKSKDVAVKACYWSGGVYLFLGFIPVLLGLVGPSLISIEGDPEQFLISLAKANLSPIMVGILSGALLSALIATIDSILLAISALVSHNFLVPVFKIKSEKAKLSCSRWVVLLAGLLAYVLAMHSTSIYDLVETASAFGAPGIIVITLVGLWSDFGDYRAALGALIVGLLATPIGEYILKIESPFLFGIACSAMIYTVFGLFTSYRPSVERAK